LARAAPFRQGHLEQQLRGKEVGNGMVDENPLNGNARLSGIAESTSGTTLGREVQIGLRLNDAAGVASQFEDDLLFAALLLEPPPHRRAARKAQELKARVDYQSLRNLFLARRTVESAGKYASLQRYFPEQQGRQRGLRSRLDQNRVPCGQGRGELVGDEVQREVEWRNTQDGADRKAAEDTEMGICPWRPV